MRHVRSAPARATLVLLALSLVLAACTGGEDAPVSLEGLPDPTTTTTTTTTLPPLEDGDRVVYEVGEFAIHPNGTQLRVDRVEVFEGGVVVQGVITNGSPFGIRIDRGITELRTPLGHAAALLVPIDSDPVGHGEDRELTLRFAPLAGADSLIVVFNWGAGSSPVSPTTSAPAFELGPFPLDSGRVRPSLPEPVSVHRGVLHPYGVELRVEGISFAPTRIGVWVRLANPTTAEMALVPATAPSHLVDDLGNRYPLVLPEGDGTVVVPAGQARSGVLSFAGRLHPGATTLTLGLNDRPGGVRPDRTVVYPTFRLEDIPLSGEHLEVPLPHTVVPDATVEHPNGVRVELSALRFTAGSIEADLSISNGTSSTVALAALPTFVADDRGNRHPLVPPPNDPQLIMESGAVITGTFVFSGRLASDAIEVSLAFNVGREASADDPDTALPAFLFGPFELERPAPEEAERVEPRVFAVGSHSHLFDDELVTSEVERVAQTLSRFDATEVEGGFMLTLPDDLLFDFDSSELRPDARQALELIAEVLRYFEGDPVRVVGHTDSVGGQAYNQRLSELRAQGVVEALVSGNGLDPGRFTAEGRGSTEPVAPNTTPEGEDDPEGRQRNRRVEIVVLTDRELPGS